jgi:hypothetical protein
VVLVVSKQQVQAALKMIELQNKATLQMLLS